MDRFQLVDNFRNLDRKQRLMIILIVLFAFVLLILLFRLNSAWGQTQYRVLTAKSNLSRGARLSPENLTWLTYPPAQIKANFYVQRSTSAKDVDGAVVLHGIKANEPITRANILPPSSALNYQALVKPDMRAVTLPIVDIGAGFVQSGDHVDIILTFNTQEMVKNEGGKFSKGKTPFNLISKTLLTHVLVLGVYPQGAPQAGSRIGKLLTGGKGEQNAKWVTFELEPKKAEVLTLASNMGVISLSLQGNVIGRSVDEDSYTTSASLIDARKVETRKITIIRGSSKEVLSFGSY